MAESDTKEEETPIEVPEPVIEPENEITLDLGGITEPQPVKATGEEVSMIIETPVSDPAPSLHEKPAAVEPTFEIEAAEDDDEYKGPEKEPYNPRLDLENYRYPTVDLMKHYDNAEPTIDMAEQNANKDKIINTLRSFGIEISTIKATVGPTVTLYEITPEQGVRISKIRGLEMISPLAFQHWVFVSLHRFREKERLVLKCRTLIRKSFPDRVSSAVKSSRSLLMTCRLPWVRQLPMKCSW